MDGRTSLTLIAVILYSGTAVAAGYGLKEFSAEAMSAAYAGSAAGGRDASYLPYNPATLAAVADADFAISLIGIFPRSEANYTVALTAAGTPAGGSLTPGSFINNAPVPGFGVRKRLSERLAMGLSVSAPWGLSTKYSDSWAGRYHGLETKLLTVNVSPIVSYQLTPEIAVAAGLQAQYADGKLTSAIDIGTIGALYAIPGSIPGAQDGKAAFKATDWAYGFTFGVMAHLGDNVTAGLAFRSAVDHTLEGPLTFRLDNAGLGAAIKAGTGLFTDTRAMTDLTTPEMINFGMRLKLSEEWSGLVEVDWTNWSRFRELRVVASNTSQPDDVTISNWKDAWFFSLGAEYQPNERWSLRAGAGYDETPVPAATRGPRIPDAARTWISAGAGFQVSDGIRINFSAAHLFIGKEEVGLTPAQPGNALRGTLSGSTESGVNVLALQAAFTL